MKHLSKNHLNCTLISWIHYKTLWLSLVQGGNPSESLALPASSGGIIAVRLLYSQDITIISSKLAGRASGPLRLPPCILRYTLAVFFPRIITYRHTVLDHPLFAILGNEVKRTKLYAITAVLL